MIAFAGGERTGDGVHGLEEFIDGRKECSGVVTTRLDDGGVVGGASTVEGFFIMLLVKLVSIQVDSKTSSFVQTFKLSAFGFEIAKMISVPWGRVSEGDCASFHRSNLVEARRKCIVVCFDKFSGGDDWSEGRVRDGVSQCGGKG